MSHEHACKGCGRPFVCPLGGRDNWRCLPTHSIADERARTVCPRCQGVDRAARKAARRAELAKPAIAS